MQGGTQVSEINVKKCVEDFFKATSDDELRESMCCICLETRKQTKMTEYFNVNSIPNIEVMNMEDPSILRSEEGVFNICPDCNTQLEKGEIPK